MLLNTTPNGNSIVGEVTPTSVIRSIRRRAFGLRRDGIEQVGVIAQRYIGMRTQAALQHVAADFAEQRIEWVLGQPARK